MMELVITHGTQILVVCYLKVHFKSSYESMLMQNIW